MIISLASAIQYLSDSNLRLSHDHFVGFRYTIFVKYMPSCQIIGSYHTVNMLCVYFGSVSDPDPWIHFRE